MHLEVPIFGKNVIPCQLFQFAEVCMWSDSDSDLLSLSIIKH